MQFFIIVLVICLVLFLFRLYHLANDDYVLMKKNITLEEVFNAAIICSLASLLMARIFYVFFNPLGIFLNPLGFILFPYFPGLSLTGAVIGGLICLFVYSRKKKIPLGRITDFFAVSLVFVLPVGMVGYFLLSRDVSTGNIVMLALYLGMLIIANIYLYPKASALEIKDGTIGVLFLIFFSLVSLLGGAINHPGIGYFTTHLENYILLIILFASIGFLLKEEIVGRMSFNNGR